MTLDAIGNLLHRDGHTGKCRPADEKKAKEQFMRSAAQGFVPGILDYGVALAQDGDDEEALRWFVKGGSDETDLAGFGTAVAECQFNASQLTLRLGGVTGALFWANRAKRNGHGPRAEAVSAELERLMWRQCANPYCVTDISSGTAAAALPSVRCSACKLVAYCGPACQREHWSSGNHKVLCRSYRDMIKTSVAAHDYDDKACAHCKGPDPVKVCGRCESANYCDNGGRCQREHWPAHRAHCKRTAGRKKGTAR